MGVVGQIAEPDDTRKAKLREDNIVWWLSGPPERMGQIENLPHSFIDSLPTTREYWSERSAIPGLRVSRSARFYPDIPSLSRSGPGVVKCREKPRA